MNFLWKQTIVKKNKTVLSLILVVALCFSLIGCNATKNTEWSIADSQDKQQTFSAPNIQWGIGVSELQKSVDWELGTEPGGTGEIADATESFSGTLFSGPEVLFMGLKGNVSYQFQNGHLWAAGVSCDLPENGNEKLDELLNAAREAFGQESESSENQKLEIEGVDQGQMFSTYIWNRNDGGQETSAILTALFKDGVVSGVTFDVSYFPNPY